MMQLQEHIRVNVFFLYIVEVGCISCGPYGHLNIVLAISSVI